MPSQLTYTGSIGPGQALTSQVFTDVTDLTFDLIGKMLFVSWGVPNVTAQLSLAANATVSWTISGNNHTISFT